MNFDMKRPCSNCPFRADDAAINLRPGRLRDIVTGLLDDDRDWFVCHKTLPRDDRSQCVGAMVYLLKVSRPSVSMRLACSVGLLDFEALRAQFADVIEPLNNERKVRDGTR